MLAKLLKYDFKSVLRQMIPVWLLAPLVAAVFAFRLRGQQSGAEVVEIEDTLTLMLGFILFGVFVAVVVMTFVFVIQRFWKGLLGNEGYLMFTLPVKTNTLILSKAISATVVTLLSSLAALVSIFIMGLVLYEGEEGFFIMLKFLWRTASVQVGEDLLRMGLASFILAFIASLISNLYRIYVSMAIGHLFPSYRVAGAAAAYLAINVVIGGISTSLFAIVGLLSGTNLGGFLLETASEPSYLLILLNVSSVLSLLVAAAFHIITMVILDKKLNLE